MRKTEKEIENTIRTTEQMILQLRQTSDGAWDYVNAHMKELIDTMTAVVEWAQQLIRNGEDFPLDVVLQQIQNLNEAYTAKDEILLADTLEYEIKNALYIYLEKGEE